MTPDQQDQLTAAMGHILPGFTWCIVMVPSGPGQEKATSNRLTNTGDRKALANLLRQHARDLEK